MTCKQPRRKRRGGKRQNACKTGVVEQEELWSGEDNKGARSTENDKDQRERKEDERRKAEKEELRKGEKEELRDKLKSKLRSRHQSRSSASSSSRHADHAPSDVATMMLQMGIDDASILRLASSMPQNPLRALTSMMHTAAASQPASPACASDEEEAPPPLQADDEAEAAPPSPPYALRHI